MFNSGRIDHLETQIDLLRRSIYEIRMKDSERRQFKLLDEMTMEQRVARLERQLKRPESATVALRSEDV